MLRQAQADRAADAAAAARHHRHTAAEVEEIIHAALPFRGRLALLLACQKGAQAGTAHNRIMAPSTAAFWPRLNRRPITPLTQ